MPRAQELTQQFTTARVVVDDQHRLVAVGCARRRYGLRAGLIDDILPDREMKSAAFFELALNGDVSIHQFDQSAADRQAEARSSESPRNQTVGLREGIEDRFPVHVRNPDTGD
jgi:hypothetical protein